MSRLSAALCALAVSAASLAGAGERLGEPAFAVCLGERSHVTGMDIEEFVALRKARRGDFLWFRRAGKPFVVTDAATLAEARAVLRPVHEVGEEMEALAERLRPYEDRQDAFDREEEALAAAKDALDERHDARAEAERERLEERLRDVESQRRALESEMRVVEEEQRGLEAREQEVEPVADEKIRRLIDDAMRHGLALPAR